MSRQSPLTSSQSMCDLSYLSSLGRGCWTNIRNNKFRKNPPSRSTSEDSGRCQENIVVDKAFIIEHFKKTDEGDEADDEEDEEDQENKSPSPAHQLSVEDNLAAEEDSPAGKKNKDPDKTSAG